MSYNKRFDPSTISDELLLSELKKLADEIGRTPSQNDIKKFGNNITKRIHLYRIRFGSLQLAQEKIGCIKNLGGIDLKYSDKDLLNEITRIKEIIAKTPTQDDMIKYGKYPSGAYKRHFGTYNNALKQLGIKPNIKFGQTIDEIKNDIFRVTKLLGRAPTINEFTKLSNTVSCATATYKIDGHDSWNNTLKLCGLDIVYNKNLTEQELKNEIIRLKEKIGRVPGYYDMIQLGKYSPESYAYTYGSYVKALNYFGFDYTPQSQWKNQTYTKGKDGTIYKSKFEALIADSLFDMHSKGVILSYIYEKKVCEERKWTCDFCVNINGKELWIEADGMGKNRAEVYNDEHEKIKYYIENDINFYILKYRGKGLIEEIINLVNRYKNEA
jgi:hypothetical protein